MPIQLNIDNTVHSSDKVTKIAFRCLPVTAIHAVDVGGCLLLASGQGPWLTIHDCQSRQRCLQEKVFEHQAIHGITSVASRSNVHDECYILIWGARYACFSKLAVYPGQVPSLRYVLHTSRTFEVDDWILHGVVTTQPSTCGAVAYVVTAHNTVHEYSCQQDVGIGTAARNPYRTCFGPQAVLYSAYLNLATLGQILVASGTVFGEIVLWSCLFRDQESESVSQVHRVFSAHRGSILGVCISKSVQSDGVGKWLLASCSDDRTIRICEFTDFLDANDFRNSGISQNSRTGSTGFSAESPSHSDTTCSSTWAHQSRIWKVAFLQSAVGKHFLISVGEDASCQLWRVGCNDGNTLTYTTKDHHHIGKNIWSLAALPSTGFWRIYTAAADGAIVERQYALNSDHNTANPKPITIKHWEIFQGLDPKCLSISDGASRVKDSSMIKNYAMISSDTVIATTSDGEILSGAIDESGQQISWRRIYSSSVPSLISLVPGPHDIAVGHQEGGTVLLIQSNPCRVRSTGIELPPRATLHMACHNHTDQVTQKICLVVSDPTMIASELIWLTLKASLNYEKTPLKLPTSFVLASTRYDTTSQMLVLGSRAGALAIYDKALPSSHSLQPTACVRHVHGSDSVTSITFVEGNSREVTGSPHILTTGRDGHYAIHKFVSASEALLEIPILITVHRSSLPFGPHIEGAHLKRTSPAGTERDLILYGFRSTEFVVWNESQQSTMFSIDCGGAHRSWALGGDPANEISSFVWTKAGAFNVYRHMKPGHCIIQSGSHGREIKALAIFGTLLATGAEDTTIRIIPRPSLFNSPYADSSEYCRVLDRHTTGIQHLEFCGQHLFSSAGCEEFFAWRIYPEVPCIKLGVVFQCALPKDPTADARIPCFTVSSTNGSNDATRIAAAFSNGKIKIFMFYHSKHDLEARFESLQEVVAGSFCLTQIQYLTQPRMDEIRILTSGTNGVLTVRALRQPSATGQAWSSSHRIHQSCVQTLTICDLGQYRKLAISGGDDNAIALTVISSRALYTTTTAFRTLLLPKAHAAAITAVTILSSDSQQGTVRVIFASTGNDQRVKVWQLTISEEQHDTGVNGMIESHEIRLSKVDEVWTTVADVSALACLGKSKCADGTEAYTVLVAGVGVEALQTSGKHA